MTNVTLRRRAIFRAGLIRLGTWTPFGHADDLLAGAVSAQILAQGAALRCHLGGETLARIHVTRAVRTDASAWK